jgi:hypothetical protein
MKTLLKFVAVIVLLVGASFAQVVAAPQYTVNLNFLTGGGVSAMDSVFARQFTTNAQLEGDLVLAPSGSATAYMGGANYNLCGIKTIENALILTSFNCGKFEPGVSFVAGVGRVQQGNLPTQQGLAYMPKFTLGYDPTGAGHYAVVLAGGYGKFGPSITGQSNSGVFFYSGIKWGGGTSPAATAAKIARIKRSDAKKLAKLQATAKG